MAPSRTNIRFFISFLIFDIFSLFVLICHQESKKNLLLVICLIKKLVEFSTFFIPIAIGKRVAKASMGLIPLPFMITINTCLNLPQINNIASSKTNKFYDIIE